MKKLKHTLYAGSYSSVNTHPHNLSPFLSHTFPFFFTIFSLILSQLYRCLMLSPCCREPTEHLSSSGGWWWWWGVWTPRFALQQNTHSSGLEGRQSTGDQTLARGPASGFHSSLASPADLGHIHVGQQQAALLLVSNLLFVLANVLSMSREGCWGGNGGKEHAGTRASVAWRWCLPIRFLGIESVG